MVFENEVAQESQTALVECNHGRYVLAAELLGRPQNSAVAPKGNYEGDRTAELISQLAHRLQ